MGGRGQRPDSLDLLDSLVSLDLILDTIVNSLLKSLDPLHSTDSLDSLLDSLLDLLFN